MEYVHGILDDWMICVRLQGSRRALAVWRDQLVYQVQGV